MRKILCTTLAILMVLSSFAVMGTALTSAASPTEKTLVGITGDADQNDAVNISDATLIQKELANNLMFDTVQELLADVDENALVNVKDATQIQKHIAKTANDCKIGEKLYAVLDFAGKVIMGSFELEYDENGNVTNIIAKDMDTVALKAEFEALVGMSCEDVAEYLVSLMAEGGLFGGFVDGEKETVIVQVAANSRTPREDFAEDISRSAKKGANRHNCKPEFVPVDKGDYSASFDEAYITLEKAQEIALTFFGVWADDATFIDTEYDIDDGTPFYELEFTANGWRFECDVNAVNGKVCHFHKERINNSKPATDDEKPAPEKPDRPATRDEVITLEEAMEIALSHAGVNAEDARFEDRDFDVEDGTPYYELEFAANGFEYEYDIHAVTGAILNVEIEAEDNKADRPQKPEKPQHPATPEELISEAEAFAIALEAAEIFDCDNEQEIELKRNRFGYYYEVEIETADRELEILVDAVTGEILDFECEFKGGYHHGRPENRPNGNKPAPEKPTAPTDIISPEEAFAKAIEAANVLPDVIFDSEHKLDNENGRLIYEIEFITQTLQFEVEVDAETGEVLSIEKEGFDGYPFGEIDREYTYNPDRVFQNSPGKF